MVYTPYCSHSMHDSSRDLLLAGTQQVSTVPITLAWIVIRPCYFAVRGTEASLGSGARAVVSFAKGPVKRLFITGATEKPKSGGLDG